MIVVFGSINVDFVTRVRRIPRPGETSLGPSYDVIPGGKGANQALGARRAGAAVALVGAVGHDPFGEIALSLLKQEGVDLARTIPAEAPTGAAFISVDDEGENAIVVASGANAHARASQMDGLALGPRDILLLQREVPEAEAAEAAARIRAAGGRVILNAAPAGPIANELLAHLDVLIVNEHEVRVVGEALGIGGDETTIAQAIDSTHRVATIVTLGSAGAIGWTGGVRRTANALPITPVDTTAAGDTFCGAFAAALDEGFGFTTALVRAAAAGSLACMMAGAQPSIPRKAVIDEAVAGFIA